jgi:nucleoside-diphosphate-sugar epimerase
MQKPVAAITGSSGFIGRHLVCALDAAGWRTRLLLRREPDECSWHGLRPEVVAGDLNDEAALGQLVTRADAVIHLAGLIKAARRAQFFNVNGAATQRLAELVRRRAPQAHFVLLSSLAAREPSLSDYAASKHAGELAVLRTLGASATVLRPPAVYGPGDRETLLFFKLASMQTVLIPGPPVARLAMIQVTDLARLIARIAEQTPSGKVASVADDRPDGYGWTELLGAAARAVGNPSPRFLHVPGAMLGGIALIGDAARALGAASMLSSQKLRELRHPDWSVPAMELVQSTGWRPEFDLDRGFADAVGWYRCRGWLPG